MLTWVVLEKPLWIGDWDEQPASCEPEWHFVVGPQFQLRTVLNEQHALA